jgi:hypothetical protein
MWYYLIFNRLEDLDLGNLKDFLNLISALFYVGIKMVRLKVFFHIPNAVLFPQFQFQNGAVRRDSKNSIPTIPKELNMNNRR